jgi:uncharacterized protein YbjT (DUF2867 family)
MKTHELVLVVGATGGTGVHLVNALRRRGYKVRALVRDAAKSAPIAAEGVEIVTGDVLADADVARAMDGVTAVLCALGSRAIGDPARAELIEHTAIAQLAKRAAASGIQRFVLCSSMGVETPEMMPPIAAILSAKRRGELALIASGVPYTIVRPGGLTDAPGGGPGAFHRNVQAAARLAGFGQIARADVAEVMAEALAQPAAANKVVEIIGRPGGGPSEPAGIFM